MEGVDSVGKVLDLNFALGRLQFFLVEVVLEGGNQFLRLRRFLVQTAELDFLAEEVDCFLGLGGGDFIDADVLLKNVLCLLLQFLYWLFEFELPLFEDEPTADGLEGLGGQLLGLDGFDEIGDVSRFEEFHGVDELLLLNLAEDCDILGQILEGLEELSTALGEGLPVHIRFLTGLLKNLFKMRLDIFHF